MNNINWSKIGLLRNPFNIIPDKESEDLIWAGFESNKIKFDSIIHGSLTSDETIVILNISRFGGGKTHTSYFYSKNENLPSVREIEPPFNILVVTPKIAEKAPWVFYTKVIEGIGISHITDAVLILRKSFNSASISLEVLQKWSKSEDLGRIIWLLADEDEDVSFGAEQLLLGGGINFTLKNKLRIRRGMTSISDISQMLGAVIQLLSKYNNKSVFQNPRRIFLWIDELESLIYYTSRQYRPFTQIIRELVDNTPNHLTILMNFSFSEPDEMRSIDFIIGEALLDRVTEQFVFEGTNKKEAKKYVKDLLSHFRIKDFKDGEYLPFSESGLEMILEKAPVTTHRPLIPRTINKWCLYAIKKANERNILGEKEIDENIIGEISFIDEAFE